MAAFHFASLIHLPTEEVQRPQLWQRLRGWINLTRTLFSDAELEVYGLQNTEAEVCSQKGFGFRYLGLHVTASQDEP